MLVRGVRALSRFSLLPVLCLCVFSGLALAGRGRILALVALALGLLESSQVPLGYGYWRGPSDVAKWLRGQAGGGDRAAPGGWRHGRHARRGGPLAAARERRLRIRAPTLCADPGASRWSAGRRGPAPLAGRGRPAHREPGGRAVARRRVVRRRARLRAGGRRSGASRSGGGAGRHRLAPRRRAPGPRRGAARLPRGVRGLGRSLGQAAAGARVRRRQPLRARRRRRRASPTPPCRCCATRDTAAARSGSRSERCATSSSAPGCPRAADSSKWEGVPGEGASRRRDIRALSRVLRRAARHRTRRPAHRRGARARALARRRSCAKTG